MNALGITLLWCGLQVTVVGTLACVVYVTCRKLGPAGRSTIALTGLLTVVGLSAIAFSPWPWWDFSQWTASAEVAFDAVPTDATEANTKTAPEPAHAVNEVKNDSNDNSDDEPSFAALFLDSFRREMQRASVPVVESSTPSWRWPGILAALFYQVSQLECCGCPADCWSFSFTGGCGGILRL